MFRTKRDIGVFIVAIIGGALMWNGLTYALADHSWALFFIGLSIIIGLVVEVFLHWKVSRQF